MRRAVIAALIIDKLCRFHIEKMSVKENDVLALRALPRNEYASFLRPTGGVRDYA